MTPVSMLYDLFFVIFVSFAFFFFSEKEIKIKEWKNRYTTFKKQKRQQL